ncbi:MAG TPA: addiction module toxin RelE [Pyrinomonadaceae bacterium]|jgi:mRNA-degrading endonuclease RelE of RelBE toxin-antitoxin system
MKVEVKITESFKKAAKPLIKKYKSFLDDLSELEAKLLVNPEAGTALGNNAYKIRLRIKSKGKGKSGGARVISYVEKNLISIVTVEDEKAIVNLLTVYDKSERENISDTELKELIESLQT